MSLESEPGGGQVAAGPHVPMQTGEVLIRPPASIPPATTHDLPTALGDDSLNLATPASKARQNVAPHEEELSLPASAEFPESTSTASGGHLSREPPAALQPSTVPEQMIYSVLASSPSKLGSTYTSNAFEHVPSRWLSLLPSPFIPLVTLSLQACRESLRQAGPGKRGGGSPLLTAAPSRKGRVSAPSGIAGQAASSSNGSAKSPTVQRTLVQQVIQTFTDVAKITPATAARLVATATGAPAAAVKRRKVLRVTQLVPDVGLASNEYASVGLPPGSAKVEPGAFIFVSQDKSQCCLYNPTLELPPGLDDLPAGSRLGMPAEMFNVQHSASAAQKRWMLLRRRPTSAPEDEAPSSLEHLPSSSAAVNEVTGQKIYLVRDRNTSVEDNAPILLDCSMPPSKRRKQG